MIKSTVGPCPQSTQIEIRKEAVSKESFGTAS